METSTAFQSSTDVNGYKYHISAHCPDLYNSTEISLTAVAFCSQCNFSIILYLNEQEYNERERMRDNDGEYSVSQLCACCLSLQDFAPANNSPTYYPDRICWACNETSKWPFNDASCEYCGFRKDGNECVVWSKDCGNGLPVEIDIDEEMAFWKRYNRISRKCWAVHEEFGGVLPGGDDILVYAEDLDSKGEDENEAGVNGLFPL